mmetsp:Transcript_15077/g.45654  ORF Transcript_15077/g.45654 Transcript_15077/m.45654 type:complete len:90 (+) Transcript_15077:581-850(+)
MACCRSLSAPLRPPSSSFVIFSENDTIYNDILPLCFRATPYHPTSSDTRRSLSSAFQARSFSPTLAPRLLRQLMWEMFHGLLTPRSAHR